MVDDSLLASYAKAYAEEGYVLVKGLLDKAEAKAYREESHALIERLNRDADPTWGSARELTMGRQTELKHCHDVQFYSGAFARLIVDPRFTDVAAAVMGTPNVQLHHTKLFVKPPEKGSPFPLHQDHPFFPHAKHSMGAAILHFDDAPLAKGCVRVVPGSHLNGPLAHAEDGGWHLPFSEWPLEKSVPCEAEAGDVLFFTYLTVHGSGVNTTSDARTTLLVQYRDPADPPTVDTHQSLGQGMILRGIDPTVRGGSAG
ncbi:phytanoyl-CoA dioxygenase family protein [Actinopolymorpha alba]|uniref:phytanoyl-CoA dioxygenase family protein n=1 Tax=Actinopolymorpha alba TaxID=533267 RepID=UPI0003803342|nr:phytanoyl-CoA dioxygenase family protein [Actinopolymorpha alba]